VSDPRVRVSAARLADFLSRLYGAAGLPAGDAAARGLVLRPALLAELDDLATRLGVPPLDAPS
jgi:hypothetical protein